MNYIIYSSIPLCDVPILDHFLSIKLCNLVWGNCDVFRDVLIFVDPDCSVELCIGTEQQRIIIITQWQAMVAESGSI